MIIDQFPSLTSPQSGDELPIERGQTVYKINYNALAAAIINKLGGDPATVSHGGTGANNAIEALNNLGGAKFISLSGASETVSSIYNALKNMRVGEIANISLGGSAMALLTGSGGSATAKVTGYGVGNVYRNTTAGDYRFFVTTPYGNYKYAFRADITSTAITTQQVFSYAGTQM